MLDAGGIDPTVINGGIINRYGSNARLGKSDWMVVEADESDGSFLRLDGTIAVVTNIDPEHLEHYGSFDAVKDAFVEFIENVPFYGLAVMCVDHPEVQNRAQPDPRPAGGDLWLLGAGRSCAPTISRPSAAAPGSTPSCSQRDGSRRTIEGICLPMPGRHNVQNALAAIAVAHRARHRRRDDRQGLRALRRASSAALPRLAKSAGRWLSTIMPTIRSKFARSCRRRAKALARSDRRGGRVIAVVQPHRFTRLRDLMEDFQNAFNDADIVFVAPVYPAGEEPIEGVDAAALAEGLRAHGHRMVKAGRRPG